MVHFNLDDVWRGVQNAASGRGGATDWELLQIKQNPQYWDTVQFWLGGKIVENPFKWSQISSISRVTGSSSYGSIRLVTGSY